MKKYMTEVEQALLTFPQRSSTHNPESYIGGGQSKLRYLGLRTPHLTQAMRNGFSFTEQSPTNVAEIWDYVWHNSDCFEVMALGLSWFYDPKKRVSLIQYWPMLKNWSSRIDNWAHSDTLSGIYARILEDHPEKVYPTLVKWSSSKNPWQRRLSIVSLLYYSSQRTKVPPLKDILPLIETQLMHDHYYVQKGVGWTLRETYNIYPKSTYTFIEKNILVLSPHAFSAATEKMSPREKGLLKSLRKKRTIQRKN